MSVKKDGVKLDIKYRNIGDIKGYDRNARTHSDEHVAQIAASIEEFGFNNPILIDETSTIIAGHGRLAAAQRLGLGGASPTCALQDNPVDGEMP